MPYPGCCNYSTLLRRVKMSVALPNLLLPCWSTNVPDSPRRIPPSGISFLFLFQSTALSFLPTLSYCDHVLTLSLVFLVVFFSTFFSPACLRPGSGQRRCCSPSRSFSLYSSTIAAMPIAYISSGHLHMSRAQPSCLQIALLALVQSSWFLAKAPTDDTRSSKPRMLPTLISQYPSSQSGQKATCNASSMVKTMLKEAQY